MRLALKTEFAPTKPAPEQQSCRGRNDCQRHQLLPIHADNITLNRPGATNDWTPQFKALRPLAAISAPRQFCCSPFRLLRTLPPHVVTQRDKKAEARYRGFGFF